MKGVLVGRNVILENGEIIDILIALRDMKENKIEKIIIGNKEYEYEDLLEFLKNNMKNIYEEYFIFDKLISKGYYAGAGFKFGALFRVYDKFDDPNKTHSKWILYILKGNISAGDLSSKIRVAHSTKKKLILYLDNKFLEVSWVKL